MIVVRFKGRGQREKAGQALALFRDIVAASRPLDGVIHFDMGRDIMDPDSFMAIEVFEDRAVLDRQESLPEVKKTMGLFQELLAGAREATIFHVSSSEP